MSREQIGVLWQNWRSPLKSSVTSIANSPSAVHCIYNAKSVIIITCQSVHLYDDNPHLTVSHAFPWIPVHNLNKVIGCSQRKVFARRVILQLNICYEIK